MFAAVLLVVVAIFSFGIGFMAGRNSVPSVPAEVASVSTPQPIAVPQPAPSIDVVEEKVEPDNLTFFDALPKGEQQPLGTGINMPPETTDPVADKITAQPVANTPQPAKVKTTAVKPATTATKTAVASTDASHVLQISSFRSPDEAGILLRRLEKKGYRPYIQQADLGSKGVWYRVFLGPYSSKEDAQMAGISLKAKEKLDFFVRRK
jgi:cell division septation protein DedD